MSCGAHQFYGFWLFYSCLLQCTRVNVTLIYLQCANCGKEAIFYCCWNTSYCDYPCQESHWPKHMPNCTQSQNQSTATPQQRGSTQTAASQSNDQSRDTSRDQSPAPSDEGSLVIDETATTSIRDDSPAGMRPGSSASTASSQTAEGFKDKARSTLNAALKKQQDERKTIQMTYTSSPGPRQFIPTAQQGVPQV